MLKIDSFFLPLRIRMIIPIKCFTCGTVIADKYRFYVQQVAEAKKAQGQDDEPVYFTKGHKEKSIEGHMMDTLGIVKPCCRRHFLTHVDIE
jgi:DNA-directed RNA polymerase subunit N (RpoN/RPB10)